MDSVDRPPALVRVLFPEGSSLSAREAIAALGPLGYQIEVCDPNPLCLSRFSRFVSGFHRSPTLGKDPLGYLRFLIRLLERKSFDVLLPVHEHAFLFSRARNTLSRYVHLAVADFSSFKRVQSKAAFTELLEEIGIPKPRTRMIHTRSELESFGDFPYYVKGAIGTAGRTVWRVNNQRERSAVIPKLERSGLLDQQDAVLVQDVAPGILEVAQSVFANGHLLAVHCYQQQVEGVGGSACARISVERPVVRCHVEQIGSHLNWHGSLMLDYIFDPETNQPCYIEANPRMGETMNATLAGINLADILVRLSLNQHLQPIENSKPGIMSHTLMGILMGLANRGASRLRLIAEMQNAILQHARYAKSEEEIVRLDDDIVGLIPLLAVSAQLIFNPECSTSIATKTVADYSLTPAAIKAIEEFEDVEAT